MTLHVADAAIASVAAAAAREVPGVVALRADLTRTLLGFAGSVLGRVRPAAEGVGVAADDEAATLVRVTIVTRMGDNCRDVAAAVQRAVTHTLAEQTGRTARVEVTVADVLRHLGDRPS